MPSTEIDDLIVMTEHINDRIAPVKLVAAKTARETCDHGPILYLVQRHGGNGGDHFRGIFRGTFDQVEAFLLGIMEGVSCGLRRW